MIEPTMYSYGDLMAKVEKSCVQLSILAKDRDEARE